MCYLIIHSQCINSNVYRKGIQHMYNKIIDHWVNNVGPIPVREYESFKYVPKYIKIN